MFTGIIEELGTVKDIGITGNSAQIKLSAEKVLENTRIGDSIAVNGVCLTVTGITSEGWNNTEGQCLAYIASQPVWDLLDCGDQNNMLIHLDGHAILRPDMETILDYCDVHLSGIPPEGARGGPARMKGNLFLQNNRALLDPLFEPYLP